MQENENLVLSDQLATEKKKKVYASPRLEVLEIEMEQGIAASSVALKPTDDPSGNVDTGWGAGSDGSGNDDNVINTGF